jgi:hypothetical protein
VWLLKGRRTGPAPGLLRTPELDGPEAATETHEDWLEASRYLNIELLKENKKLRLSPAA